MPAPLAETHLQLGHRYRHEVEHWAQGRRAAVDPGPLVRFIERSIAMLPEPCLHVARYGFAGGRFALVIGNYYLSCVSSTGLGLAALDTAAVAYRMKPFVYRSAAGPVIYAHYPMDLAPSVAGEGRFWETYAIACEILLDSSQGRSPLFLTSRSREPLPNVIQGDKPGNNGHLR